MKAIHELQGSEQQLLHTEAMELFSRIIQPADKVESWLHVKNACETLGPDSVIDSSIDSATMDVDTDRVLFDRAVGACIYQYFFGSEKSAEREFYAAQWLLSDLVHGYHGFFDECLEGLSKRQLTELANFGFRITNTRIWGLNRNGPDNMFSLACLCSRAHAAWLHNPTPYQLEALKNTSKVSLEYFSFAPYLKESEKMIKPCMYMSLEDALWFVIGVVHEYPLEGMCERIDGSILLSLVEDLYDEYLDYDDITLLHETHQKVASGSQLSEFGHECFNFNPSENWRDTELSEKVEVLRDFFELAINRCKEDS